jgi:putative MATE family efflux protein
MKTTVTYRQIWLIAYPIIIGSVAQNLINITDTAFLGRVGQAALGAGAIGGIFYLVSVMLTWGLGIGTQIIIARRNGEKSFAEIGRTFQHGFYFQMPLALSLFSLMQFFSADILKYIIQSEDVYALTREYLQFRSFGIFFAGVNMLFRGFYIGITRTKVITYTTTIMAMVNAFLDYCLIFGKFGLPEMGIGGAALASVIAEFSATIFFTFYTLFRLDGQSYNLYRRVKFDNDLYKKIIRISLPVMMQNFISMTAWLVFFLFIEKLGERALAVSNIIRSFYIILMIPMWGFSSATNTLVSNLIGQGRGDEVMSLVMKVMKLCAIGVFFLVMIGFSFPELALKVYTNDPVLMDASLPVLFVVNFAAFFLAVGFVFFSAVSGTGKTNVSFTIELVVIVLYLSATYIMADVLRLDIFYIWMAEFFYAFLLGTMSFIYLKSNKWKSTHV